MKNEMYYGSEKEYTSFKVFAKAVKEYIHYFNKERIQKKQNGCLPKYIGKHPLMPFN
ncbi:MAG: IS3 family transposase [Acidaminococcus intestini]